MVSLNPLTSGMLAEASDTLLSRRTQGLKRPELAAREEAGVDRLEITDRDSTAASEVLSAGRIANLRARIASGVYVTPEKMDVVTERLHAEIFGH